MADEIQRKMGRVQVLAEASRLTSQDRQAQYGDPVVNYTHTARLLTAYFSDKIGGYQFTAEDSAMIQVLVKQSRIAGGVWKDDNFIDAAAYMAIAAECGGK